MILGFVQSDLGLLGFLLVLEHHGGTRFVGLDLEELHEVFYGGWVEVPVELFLTLRLFIFVLFYIQNYQFLINIFY